MSNTTGSQVQEKILHPAQGWKVLIATTLVYIAAIIGVALGGIGMDNGSVLAIPLFVLCLLYTCFGWIFWLGLKVIRPNEAVVLTLFGKYIGTLKGAGFYFIHPFCTAVNPAARTTLRQSGDVTPEVKSSVAVAANGSVTVNPVDKKISLKVMTLNNQKQKINDCLGNPVEIGIAVIWRVTDTAKAVFNVDNYK